MRDSWQDQDELRNTLSLFILILLFVFAVELFIMDLFTPLFSKIGPVAGSLLDAVLITVASALPLLVLLRRLRARIPYTPWRDRRLILLLAQALCGIFLTELLVMLLEPVLFPGADPRWLKLGDAAVTTLVSALPVWWFLFRPCNGARAATIAEELDTPLRLFAFLLVAVFLVDLLREATLRPSAFDIFPGITCILDSCVTALFTAPVLWVVVGRPLKREARSGRARATALYSQVVDAIVVLDRHGILTSCNPAAERTFRFTSVQIRGLSAAVLFQEGEAGLKRLLEGVAARDGEERVHSREILCRCSDGTPLVMDVSLSEVLQEERTDYLLIMRDITGRKKMEEALRESETSFRRIFEDSAEAILFFRLGNCEILDLNCEAEKMFGYTKGELRGGGLDLIAPFPDHEELCREICAMKEDTPLIREKMSGRRKDGTEILLSLLGKVMELHGEPVVYCSFRDITERVRMEEMGHQMETKLIQANKMTSLGLLVSGVAHEINNPNNYVTVSARLMERIWQDALVLVREYHEENGDFALGGVKYEELEPRSRELIEGIVDGSRRINEIVTNLKRFARQEVAAPEEVDLNAVATSAVSLMRHELIKFTDRFEMELAEESRPVRGSRQQLGQVVINLLMNACQALPGRESAIRLATAFDPGAGEMEITVTDEGRGMSREESRRIWEPFFTTKLEQGGTGLGLSICESIVKEHHGTLRFLSAPGRGTTFTVRIPVGESPAPTEHG